MCLVVYRYIFLEHSVVTASEASPFVILRTLTFVDASFAISSSIVSNVSR